MMQTKHEFVCKDCGKEQELEIGENLCFCCDNEYFVRILNQCEYCEEAQKEGLNGEVVVHNNGAISVHEMILKEDKK